MARPGLRLSQGAMHELSQAYQVARDRKNLDMTQRIQGLLMVSQEIGERKAAQAATVGRRTLQDWSARY